MSLTYTNRGPSRILTDNAAQWPSSTWTRCTTLLPPPPWLARRRGRAASLLCSLLWGLRLFRARRRFACAVTDGAGAGAVLAILQALLPGRRLPHVMMDCLWYRETKWWRRPLARLKFSLLGRSVSAFVVWASAEVEDYARELRLPRGKLIYLPFHHTLRGYEYTVGDDGSVFAGGDGDRDYATLLAAAQAISAPLLIATRRSEWLHPKRPLPANVTVRALTPDEFRAAMARARVVVVPMTAGLLHSGGQQTYLNAMAMGKAVVVCDARGAPDYITDGVTGLVVPAGDASRLAQAVSRVLDDADLRETLGRQAAVEIERRDLSTEGCMRRIVELAEGLMREET